MFKCCKKNVTTAQTYYKFNSLIILFWDFCFRHMLNVTWEHNDFSFNTHGYLVNPAMIIITLDRERQWDKVR